MSHTVIVPKQSKRRNAMSDDLESYDLTIDEAKDRLVNAAIISQSMIELAYEKLSSITNQSRNSWVDSFNSDEYLLKWFGQAKKKNHVKDVERRLDKICRRISNGLTIRFRPQKKRSHPAHNRGTFFEPKTFKVFPSVFGYDSDVKIAYLYIHELMHVWFKEQRLDREKVYGESLATSLAIENPKRARKSADNYGLFCLELYNSTIS